MKKRLLKRSEVLREGYIKGLRKAQGIISRMLSESSDDMRDELLLAIRNGDIKSVKRLLEDGVDVNSKPSRGFMRSPWLCDYTPLQFACVEDQYEVAELLIAKGAYVNAVESRGKTPLHLAAGVPAYSIVRLLLQNGADTTIKDNYGKTAADYALDAGDMSSYDIIKQG